MAAQNTDLRASEADRRWTQSAHPDETPVRHLALAAPSLEPLVELRSVGKPRGILPIPASRRRHVVRGGLWAVVPPGVVPHALKERLRVVLAVRVDEVQISP